MSIPYIQASMANVRAVDGTFISYPFIEDGDTDTKVYNMVCTQQATEYSASQVALDTVMSSAVNAGVISLPFSSDSAAYFVGDTGHAPVGGGMISFTRTFANIPKGITVPSGSAFVTFPGILRTVTFGTQQTVTSVTMTSGVRGITLSTVAAHGLAAGNQVHLDMAYTIDSDPFIHQVSGQFVVLEVPTTTSARIDIGHYWDSQVTITATDISFFGANYKRIPTSFNMSTQTRYDYILPGVTPGISSALDINLPKPFQAVSAATTLPVDTISSATYPDTDEYMNMIENEHNITIEASLSKWAGNILVMKTKTCKAR